MKGYTVQIGLNKHIYCIIENGKKLPSFTTFSNGSKINDYVTMLKMYDNFIVKIALIKNPYICGNDNIVKEFEINKYIIIEIINYIKEQEGDKDEIS